TSSSATISGTVVAASTASAGKAAVISDGVAVQIVSYDVNNNELGKASVTTDSNGGFVSQLNLSSGGGYVVITATKEGYSQYQKRVDYTTPGNLELQAAMERIAFTKELTVDSSGIKVISKSAEPSFDFAIFRYANGTKKAVAGKSAILATKSAADATLEMGLSIPSSSLPGVNSVDVKASTYDPASNPLPGSYTATDSSGKEGKMVSLAFDYLDLKANTSSGSQNLGTVAKALVKSGVKKAAEKNTVYTRYIYTNSCDNLFLEDYNTKVDGWQVPVWSLNPSSGKWVFIGEGTVSDSSGTAITSPTVQGCKTNDSTKSYYLTINVSNTEFQNNYWNLDHIVFSTPTKVCLSGTFADTKGNGLANMGVSLNGSNFDSSWGRTNANGTYTLETVILNTKDTTRTGTLYFYDNDGVYQSQPVTLDATYPTCKTFDKSFPVPCTVSGKLVDDAGKGIAYRNLYINGNNFYKGVGTDADGAFTSKVKCGEPIKVYSGTSTALATFNVNSTVETGETSDDGKAVVLANITAPNMAPSGYAYFANSSINLQKTTTLTAYVSGYDADNNYPLTYTLTIGSTVKTGTIAATDAQPIEVAVTGLSVGTHNATLELKDSKNASSGVQSLGQVYVSNGNRAPVAQLYASTSYVKACGTSRSVTLYGSAYDYDGDNMTGVWSLDSGTAPSCNGGTAAGGSSLSASCTTDLPLGSGPYTYRYTVTDSNAKAGAAIARISTYNNGPVVSLKADKTLVASGATGADRVVTLTASASDPDGDTITSTAWYLDGTALTSCSGTTCSYTIPVSATLGQTFTFRYTASDCAATGANTVKVTYGQVGDITVNIQ
ncbi:hypothetical protein, partial [Trichlorobacter lovleyi]|uniref:hypothetical protein n=1 Tax=Trichlorobacter lovleyi TaxID=313985 RepID=UPI0023F18995